jgi:sialate O-acetylesterase
VIVCGRLQGDVKPSPLFSEGTVLQQGVPIQVWGTASAGENVTVRLDGQEASATADKDGKWKVRLPTREAGGPYELSISGNNTLNFGNVMVGEVWVCAGQSNMAFDLKGADNSAAEMASANYPNLRVFRVGQKGYALPQSTLPPGKWVSCSPETAGGFPAVGYYSGATC